MSMSAEAPPQKLASQPTHTMSNVGALRKQTSQLWTNPKKVVPPYKVDYAVAAAPLGLCAFSGITFASSLMNCGYITTVPNILVGAGFTYGGLVQLIVGMWDILQGDALSAALFSSFGGYWMAFGVIFLPQTGVADAFGGMSTDAFAEAQSVLQITFGIFTTFMLFAANKRAVLFITLLVIVDIIYFTAAAANLTHNPTILKANGWLGIIAAFLGWYHAINLLTLTPATSYVQLWDKPIEEIISPGTAATPEHAESVTI